MPNVAGALRRRMWQCVAGVLLLPPLCLATDVRVVAITPGRSADVVIDGAPITLEVGEETPEGIKLLSADRDRAVLRVDGKTKTLSLAAERPAVEGGATTRSGTVILSIDAAGHFTARGFINGRSISCLIDTGATVTTLSVSSAERIGLDYLHGAPTKAMTVNGVVDGWRVSLDSVRIGDVTVREVDAIVVDNDTLPVVLLGMSFLGRFDMHRQGPTLVLRRRR